MQVKVFKGGFAVNQVAEQECLMGRQPTNLQLLVYCFLPHRVTKLHHESGLCPLLRKIAWHDQIDSIVFYYVYA